MEDVVRLHVKDVFEALETSPEGLTSEEAGRRLSKYGFNILVEKKQVSIAYKFLTQLKDLFGVLLVFASLLAAVDGIVENSTDMLELSFIILAVVLVNAVFSLFQEWRAEKAMETLRRWMPEYAKVFRDGELKKILVKELVPGDVIVVEEGDRVPADARLIEAFDLWTNNVPLTGESEPQPRTTKLVEEVDLAYIDAPNLVFMSTSVAKGNAKAVVFATGMDTKFGQIAGLTQEIAEEPSPLQKEIAYTAKYDFIVAITVGSVFFLLSLVWLHLSFVVSILFMIGVMVCCVPEGFQVTVSSALAINVLKMVKENVLVKRLSAVQTLGSVTVICTDKTGTITTGEMTVTKMWVSNKIVEVSGVGYTPTGEFTVEGKTLSQDAASVERLLEISAMCNSAKVDPPSDRNKSWSVIGDPTDGALLVAALKHGLNIDSLLSQKPIVHMIPFDSKRKRMTTIHKHNGKLSAYSKGAPRSILSICNKIVVNDKVEDLTEEHLQTVEAKIHEFASEGLRVIAIAYADLPIETPLQAKNVEQNMTLVGLAAMKDPPRPEVKRAVELAKQAGIKIVIITGDYGPTAQAIAAEVGIVEAKDCRVIRGVDLESLSDQAIMEEVKKSNVIFARVSPEQKLRIVKTLKQNGEIVAVTGDGANDAPSLKEADIGIAMGVSGTDVARESSDMVLLDDSFASIVKAVESGRTIYENLRRFIVYVFAHNWAELIPYVLYALLGIPLPLLVVQILAIDLGIDVIPSLALSREPSEYGIMQEPPRSIKERLFSTKVFLRSLYIGMIIATGAMIGCLNAWAAGGWHFGMQLDPTDPVYIKGTTMTFAGIVVAQVGNVLACRTNKASIFKTSLKSNKWIWLGIVAQLSIISMLIYVPLMQGFFGTTAIGLADWAFLAALACTVVLAEEIRKWFSRRLAA
ncbi:MAG TPA: cation-transporting P-type ATPase [Candidatus Bathyarchaeia archaeon]|nr:cation-transporting P-type ATPase [Candidatus Bathyarchaeia archaeon]